MHGFLPAMLYGKSIEFRHLQEYLVHVSGFLDAEARRFRSEVEAAAHAEQLDGEDRDALLESHEEEYDRWHGSFPSTLLASTLISACSRLETGLVELTKDLEVDPSVPTPEPRPKDGTPREKSATFLAKNFGIMATTHAKWPVIQAYFRVRDCFAHALGDVALAKNPGEIEAAVREIKRAGAPGITIDTYRKIIIERSFVEWVIKDMAAFWTDLEEALVENAVVGPVIWP